MPPKKSKAKAITVVPKFGGRRCPAPQIPPLCKSWRDWDCDPTKTGPPKGHHAYGSTFPWHFDMLEKAYVFEGTATLTADDPEKHGAPVKIGPGDLVTFPKGWRGTWEVHEMLRKRYAFFDSQGLQVDEDEDEDEDEEDEAVAVKSEEQSPRKKVKREDDDSSR